MHGRGERRRARWFGLGSLLAAAAATMAVVGAPASPANTMVVQPDGKIVMAGSSHREFPYCNPSGCRTAVGSYGTLVRFNADGSLDTTFGTGGGLIDLRTRFGGPGFSVVPPLATASGGGLLVGRGRDVAAYDADGSVDYEFGRNGVSPLELPPAFETWLPTPRPAAFATLPDGRTALAGTLTYDGRLPHQRGFAVLIAADGVVPGSTEVLPGRRGSPVGGTTVEDVVAGPTGVPLVAGEFANGPVPRGFLAPLDPGWDGSEGVELPAGTFTDLPDNSALAAALRDDDTTIVAGETGQPPVNVLLARVDAGGARDPGFGEGGVAIDQFPGAKSLDVSDAALQSDGKILVAGKAIAYCAPGQPSSGWCRIPFLVRFEADGELDIAFADGGRFQLVPRPFVESFDPAGVSVHVGEDGSILLGSSAWFKDRFTLARLSSGGQLEPSFGEGGIATADPCQGSSAQLRTQGCLSTVRANLTVRGVSQGRPVVRLFARTSTPLDPVFGLRLKLPKPIRARGKETMTVHPLIDGHRANLKARGRTVVAEDLVGTQRPRLTVPPRLLRSPQGFTRGRKLVFHLRVDLFDGSQKWFRIVRRSH